MITEFSFSNTSKSFVRSYWIDLSQVSAIGSFSTITTPRETLNSFNVFVGKVKFEFFYDNFKEAHMRREKLIEMVRKAKEKK